MVDPFRLRADEYDAVNLPFTDHLCDPGIHLQSRLVDLGEGALLFQMQLSILPGEQPCRAVRPCRVQTGGCQYILHGGHLHLGGPCLQKDLLHHAMDVTSALLKEIASAASYKCDFFHALSSSTTLSR